MRRREFIALCSSAAIALPLAARAQQSKSIARIGFLGSDPDNPLLATGYSAFIAELRKLGFAEGENLIVERGRIDEGADKAFASAADVIRSKADVVVAFGPEIALEAAVAASRATPIVMIAVNYDPIAGGYVNNITRPDKNITGLVARAPELAAKQLELLVEAFPNNKTVAALWEPASAEQFESAQRTAQSLHLELRSHKVENPPFDFDAAFRAIGQDESQMVLVLSGPTFGAQRQHIADLAIHHRLPTMFTFPYYVEAGGLMSYGIDTVPDIPPRRRIRCQASARRAAGRSSGRTANQFRIQPELENRKSDRRLNTDIDPAARRSGNRIARLRGRSAFFALTKSLNSSCPHLLRASTSWCAIYEQRRGWPEQVRP